MKIKQLLRLAAEREHRSVASMIEVFLTRLQLIAQVHILRWWNGVRIGERFDLFLIAVDVQIHRLTRSHVARTRVGEHMAPATRR